MGTSRIVFAERVPQDILEKRTFLLYFNQKHHSVPTSTAWDDPMQSAAVEILILELTPLILQRCGWNEKALQALDERPKTWVHLGVLQVVGEENVVAERLQVALDCHMSVSDQAVAHLNLLRDSTFRTPWLAAKL